MELKFQKKITPCITERICGYKKETVWLEAGLNDEEGEISRVLTLNTHVYLKGKEITQTGISVSVEAEASFLCITGNNRLTALNSRKEITIVFDAPEAEPDWQIMAELSSQCISDKIANAHKVGAEVSIGCKISCYCEDSYAISGNELQEQVEGIHIRCRQENICVLTNSVEKTFVISEPLYTKNSMGAPEKIIDSRVEYLNLSCQTVSEKMIIKGNARLTVIYIPERSEMPVSEEYILPFTQLVDAGREGLCCEKTVIETISSYVNIGYAINGEKIIEAEIHGVSQFLLSETREKNIAENAYSNIYSCSCISESTQVLRGSEKETVNTKESVHFTPEEGVHEIIFISSKTIESGTVPQLETICVYGDASENIRWTRKTSAIAADGANNGNMPEKIIITSVRAASVDDGITVETELSLEYVKREKREISFVEAIEIDTEEPTDFDALPDIVLVRADGEDMWELAKRYHSTVEEILEINGEGAAQGELILIPKAK